MEEIDLIRQVRQRAQDTEHRTDTPGVAPARLPAPATSKQIETEEALLGFRLHPLHRRVLSEVANGGFGPGFGLIGVPPGALDAHGRSLAKLRADVSEGPKDLLGLAPLVDWGDGIWSFAHNRTGAVITIGEGGPMDVGLQLSQWLELWVAAESLWLRTVVIGEKQFTNPFTKQKDSMQVVVGLAGSPYRPTDEGSP
jgi:hypothetical protein